MTAQIDFWIQIAAYGGVFLGALLAFDAITQLVARKENGSEARNRRMRMIARGASTEDRLRLLKPTSGTGPLGALSPVRTLGAALRQAGFALSPLAFLSGCLAGTVLLSVFASFILPPVAALAAGPVLGFGLPVTVLMRIRKKRVDLLIRQLPDALDLMARGLRVGHPLNATIASVAHDMADPVATEFGIMVDQIAYGDTLVDAVTDLAQRAETEDMRYLSIAIAIQHGTGGDLAQVLGTLGQVIRDRLAMRRKIVAISAEGRLTSTFLTLLPFFILASTSISAPNYYIDVMDDPLFRPFAAFVSVLIVVNFLAMRKLVSFRF